MAIVVTVKSGTADKVDLIVAHENMLKWETTALDTVMWEAASDKTGGRSGASSLCLTDQRRRTIHSRGLWAMHQYQRDFIELALARHALQFGKFTLRSGRIKPYFFNAGLFNDGASLALLGRC